MHTRTNQYEMFIELFCAHRASLENPSLRTGSQGRNFCIMEHGDMDGTYGYWVQDDECGEVGFLPEVEDVFWTYDEINDVWNSQYFKGRRLRRGPTKGKGKGKGSSGRRRFNTRRKGKGKGSDSHMTEESD